MKRFIPILLIAALVTGYLLYKRQHPDFTYAGTVEVETVDISPGVASPIAGLYAREGDLVKAGQLLIQLSCPELRVAAGQAQSDLNRNQSLFDAGSLAAANFDRSRYASRDAQVKLGWCDIQAPVGGTVTTIYRRVGEWARPGQNLLTLADLTQPYVFIYVPQTVFSKLKVGQEVICSLPELEGKKIKGTLAYIRPEAEFTPKNVQTREERARLVYGVKLRLENKDGLLKPGMSLEADLPR